MKKSGLPPIFALPALAIFIGTVAAQENTVKPSFDCAKAESVIEHAICDDRMLSIYDSEIARIYRTLRKDGPSSIRQSQKTWIGVRDACGQSKNVGKCLLDNLKNRVSALMAVRLEHVQRDYGPLQPYLSVEALKVQGDGVVYLGHHVKYIYGEITTIYFVGAFSEDATKSGLKGQGNICFNMVSDEDKFLSGDPDCDTDRALKLFHGA